MAKHPTLTDARDEAGICEAAARFTWFEVHNGEDCPGKMIPTPQELAAWFPECPDGPKDETIPRLKAVFDHVIADRLRDPDTQYSLPENFRREISWTVLDQIKQYQLATVCLVIDPKNPLLPKVKVPGPFLYTLDILHRDWASMPDGERPQHPLTPIIRAWQIRPTATEPFLPKRRASLPSLQTIDHENITLPDFPGSDATAPVRQMALPGFEPAVTMCPSWLLWLYDRAGGESMTAGRGAPWDLHLFVSSFLHLGIDQRDGHWKTLRFPHLVEHEADWPEPGTPSVERWLFPDGRAPATFRLSNSRSGFRQSPRAARAWTGTRCAATVLKARRSIAPTCLPSPFLTAPPDGVTASRPRSAHPFSNRTASRNGARAGASYAAKPI